MPTNNKLDVDSNSPSAMRKKLRAIRIQKQIAKHEAEIKQIEKHHNKMNEEAEQLDEISKAKKAAYLRKAEKDRADAADDADYHADSMYNDAKSDEERKFYKKGMDKANKRFDKRDKGIKRAMKEGTDVEDAPFKGGHEKRDYKDRFGNMVKKKNLAKHLAKKGQKEVTKEEVEQIDEISKELAQRYKDKASKQIPKHERIYNSERRKQDRKSTFAADTERGKYHGRKWANREDGVWRADKRLAKEEVEQIDEISQATKKSYLDKADKDHYDMFVGKKPGTKQKLDKRRAMIQKVSKDVEGKKRFTDMSEEKAATDKECWDGYEKKGTKAKDGKIVNDCVKESIEDVLEAARQRLQD